MQRKIHAGAGCEDLRTRCSHFYEVAAKLHGVTGNEELGRFALETFRARYKVRYCSNTQMQSYRLSWLVLATCIPLGTGIRASAEHLRLLTCRKPVIQQ